VVANGASGSVSISTPGGAATSPGFIYATLNEWVVKPNPAKDIVIVKHPASAKDTYLKLIDITGRTVKVITIPKNLTQSSFSVNGMATGIYKLIWEDDSRQLRKTLIITH
jgi:hypothetical protein